VAHWYWGDYNNKVLPIWEGRDLINALYGTAPLYMFNYSFWEANKERFVRSYRMTVPIARATGYWEMTDHRYLNEDRGVQQSTWANGVRVVVNFGQDTFTAADGTIVPGRGVWTSGVPGMDRP
jgi:hypothetical protein